jgi:hypothetical protein
MKTFLAATLLFIGFIVFCFVGKIVIELFLSLAFITIPVTIGLLYFFTKDNSKAGVN